MSCNIEDVWKVEQEILDVFHKVCVDNNLKYSIAYGTLLGAVRHKGFIPWDDDIDVIMPREDYEKLRTLWVKNAPKEYIFQDYYTDKNYINNFAKIRKDKTAFVQSEKEKDFNYHKGIFIDIFPADRVPNSSMSRKIQKLYVAINLLCAHGYTSGSKGAMGIFEKILLKSSEKTRLKRRNKAEIKIRKYNNNKSLNYMFACTMQDINVIYPSNLFDNLVTVNFNGKDYLSVKNIDGFLTIAYGDYMKLPPEEERVWKHHPIMVDFEHNYEEIK